MKKALLSITILGLFCFFRMTVGNAQTPQDIAKKGLASTVSLTMKNGSYGSGFFVLPDQIATAYHVVEGSSEGHVSPFLKKEQYPIVAITAIDQENDLVILKVSGAHGIPLPIGDSEMVEVLDTIYVVGNPGRIPGTATPGEITNLLGQYFLMNASISPGSSGGAVLNDSGEVIGVSKGNIPGTEGLNQNLNIAIPSKYLTPLVEKAKAEKERLNPSSAKGVTGTHLTWAPYYPPGYAFTVRNQRNETIDNLLCLVIFRDGKGEIICVDRFKHDGKVEPGEVARIYRAFHSDNHSYHISPVGPSVEYLMKSYEIRILDFDVSHSKIRYVPLEGVTGSSSRFTWINTTGTIYAFSYFLQNHLKKDVTDVYSYVVFYDKKGAPIVRSLGGLNRHIPAMGEVQIKELVVHPPPLSIIERMKFEIYTLD